VRALLVSLYVVAVLFELGGLGTIASDIRDARRRAREIAERPVERYAITRMRRTGKNLTDAEVKREIDTARANAKASVEQIRADLLEVLVGDGRRRVVGLIALVVGLLLGFAANVASIFR
jgi:hypothetical protein